MAFTFEKLLVDQKSADFADQIYETTERFRRGDGFLVYRLNLAAPSIPVIIAIESKM